MTCSICNNNPCGCNRCDPAKYGCDFQIMANPYDASIWNVTINGATTRVKIPKIAETDTKLSASYTNATLTYNAEKHIDTITGAQLGALINMEDLRDAETANADNILKQVTVAIIFFIIIKHLFQLKNYTDYIIAYQIGKCNKKELFI